MGCGVSGFVFRVGGLGFRVYTQVPSPNCRLKGLLGAVSRTIKNKRRAGAGEPRSSERAPPPRPPRPSVGSYGGGVFYERGTPVPESAEASRASRSIQLPRPCPTFLSVGFALMLWALGLRIKWTRPRKSAPMMSVLGSMRDLFVVRFDDSDYARSKY